MYKQKIELVKDITDIAFYLENEAKKIYKDMEQRTYNQLEIMEARNNLSQRIAKLVEMISDL